MARKRIVTYSLSEDQCPGADKGMLESIGPMTVVALGDLEYDDILEVFELTDDIEADEVG